MEVVVSDARALLSSLQGGGWGRCDHPTASGLPCWVWPLLPGPIQELSVRLAPQSLQDLQHWVQTGTWSFSEKVGHCPQGHVGHVAVDGRTQRVGFNPVLH